MMLFNEKDNSKRICGLDFHIIYVTKIIQVLIDAKIYSISLKFEQK